MRRRTPGPKGPRLFAGGAKEGGVPFSVVELARGAVAAERSVQLDAVADAPPGRAAGARVRSFG